MFALNLPSLFVVKRRLQGLLLTTNQNQGIFHFPMSMSAVKCQKCAIELLEKGNSKRGRKIIISNFGLGSGAWRVKNTSLTDIEQEVYHPYLSILYPSYRA